MLTKQSRADINRANSQYSTGPKTHEGKKRSSANALRHGLTGQLVVMPTEDMEAYERHLKSFTGEYNPQGATEAHLVQALADASWRLNRTAVLETNLLTLAAALHLDRAHPVRAAMASAEALEKRSKALANLSMHTQRLSRQFERTVNQLREIQKGRREREEQVLENLLDIMEVHKSKGEPYNPSDDGFVFSEAQINEAIRTRNRKNKAAEASNHRRAAA